MIHEAIQRRVRRRRRAVKRRTILETIRAFVSPRTVASDHPDLPESSEIVHGDLLGGHVAWRRVDGPKGALPLILLHGGLVKERIFERLFDTPSRPVWALRFPDDHPVYQGQLSDFVDLARAWLNQVVPDGPYHLLGLSFGALVATELTRQPAMRPPHSLTLVAPVIPGIHAEEPSSRQGPAALMRRASDRVITSVMSQMPRHSPEFRRQGRHQNPLWAIHSSGEPASIYRCRPASWYRQLVAALASAAETSLAPPPGMPTLILQGSHDTVVPVWWTSRLSHAWPAADFQIVNQADHTLLFSAADRTRPLIDAHCQQAEANESAENAPGKDTRRTRVS